VLEARAEQHPPVLHENVLGAVAVVHVKVDDSDLVQSVLRQRVRGSGGDVVEQAKAHGLAPLRVVAGRSDAAEGIVRSTAHQQVDRVDGGARGAIRGTQGRRAHEGVGIEPDIALPWRDAVQPIEVLGRMDAQQLLAGDRRCRVVPQQVEQTAGNEPVLDGPDAPRALGMRLPDVVIEAFGVADVGGFQGR